MIKSVYENNKDILEAIRTLYCQQGFECDLTYGNGAFWKDSQKPWLCFDITPLHEGVIQASSCAVPVENESLTNCVFDPPFLTYVKNGREHNSKVAMTSRFGGYYRYEELVDHYTKTIMESYRILKVNGYLVFKCQDVIHNHKMHCTHLNVCNWAKDAGFFLEDLFILSAKNRMPGPQKGIQRHARVFHSYFLVFKKLNKKQ